MMRQQRGRSRDDAAPGADSIAVEEAVQGREAITTLTTTRNANEQDATVLEALQRRSSDVWEEYREQLAAHPDAIQFPQHFIDHGWTRAAVLGDDPVGFLVVIPGQGGSHELDGLFVEPGHMRRGIGRSLMEHACERALNEDALDSK